MHRKPQLKRSKGYIEEYLKSVANEKHKEHNNKTMKVGPSTSLEVAWVDVSRTFCIWTRALV